MAFHFLTGLKQNNSRRWGGRSALLFSLLLLFFNLIFPISNILRFSFSHLSSICRCDIWEKLIHQWCKIIVAESHQIIQPIMKYNILNKKKRSVWSCFCSSNRLFQMMLNTNTSVIAKGVQNECANELHLGWKWMHCGRIPPVKCSLRNWDVTDQTKCFKLSLARGLTISIWCRFHGHTLPSPINSHVNEQRQHWTHILVSAPADLIVAFSL